MKKRWICVVIAGITAASMLTGCGGSSNSTSAASSDSTVAAASSDASEADTSSSSQNSDEIPAEYKDREVVNYWFPYGGDSETWERGAMDKFNQSQDKYYIRGQYVSDGAGVNNGKLLAAIQSGDVPDVIISDNPTGTYSLATQGAFEQLDDALERSGFDWDSINPAVIPMMKYQDKTYLYVANTDAVLLFIRNDMAKEAGLDLNNPPKTIDELDQWAQAMTKVKDNGDVDCYGFIPWLDAGAQAGNWGVQFGASVYDADSNTYNVDTKEMEQVYNWMRSYSDRFDKDILMGFTSNLGGAFSADHAFFTGDVGMTIVGNWFCNAISQYAPDLEYTLAPVPAVSEDLYGGTPLTGNVYAVPKGAKNIDGALAWINFMQEPEMKEDNNAQWLSLGIKKDSYEDFSRYKAKDPAELMCVDVTFNKNSRYFCVSPKTAELSDDLDSTIDTAVYTNDDIPKALQDISDKLNK